MLKCE